MCWYHFSMQSVVSATLVDTTWCSMIHYIHCVTNPYLVPGKCVHEKLHVKKWLDHSICVWKECYHIKSQYFDTSLISCGRYMLLWEWFASQLDFILSLVVFHVQNYFVKLDFAFHDKNEKSINFLLNQSANYKI